MFSPANIRSFSNLFVVLLPFSYFLGGSLLVVATSFYFVSHPTTMLRLRSPISRYSLYQAPPKEGTILGASTVKEETRAVILEKYLESQKSESASKLAEKAEFMIQTSDRYGLDWRLMPAIAGQESSFCRTIPFDSNNCWGWAVHENFTRKFSSLEEAIDRVGKSLRQDFLDQNLSTPCEIMTKYTPASVEKGGTWCKGVEFFMLELENYSD